MHIKDRPITLGQKTRELITTKLNIYNVTTYAQLWDWQVGAKNTLNPVPAMLHTLKDIWNDKYHFHGGSWLQTDNPFNITRDTKINFLNKIYNSYLHVLKPLTSKYGIYWRQSNGHGSYGSTIFKVWTLTYYREHTNFEGSNHREWKSKKFLFSKYWTNYDYKFFTDDIYGCSEKEVSEKEYERSFGREY